MDRSGSAECVGTGVKLARNGNRKLAVRMTASAKRYLVAIFGPGASAYSAALKRRLRKRIRELSDTLPAVIGFAGAKHVLSRDPKTPIVGIYMGGKAATDDDVLAIRSLVASSAVIIPVVEDLADFGKAVPPELLGINGIALSRSDPKNDTIVNLALENLGLLRSQRRIFISYRRADAAIEALQLRHELDAHGYDVFLDTHSVAVGDPFQEVLWQRMADSDVVVVLDTPGFMASRWTKEELAQAEAMTIGIVQLIWPGHKPAPYTDLCERIYLAPADFSGPGASGLVDMTLKAVATTVERLRARSLAARHNNLVREFCDAVATESIDASIQPDQYVSATLPSGQHIAAIFAVGVLDAQRYHEASLRFADDDRVTQVILVYDHRGLRPKWRSYLDWLDDFLPVKAIQITSVAARLKSS
jgi:hypothetical protein